MIFSRTTVFKISNGCTPTPVSRVADLRPIEERSAKFPVNCSKFLITLYFQYKFHIINSEETAGELFFLII